MPEEKKVWEETWHVWSYEGPPGGRKKNPAHMASVCDQAVLDNTVDDELHECILSVRAKSEDHVMARAKLAAQATAMARLLQKYP